MKQDLRQDGRIDTDRIIILRLSDGTNVQAQMINLSLQGAGICYPVSAEIGTQLTLVLPLTYGDEQYVVMTDGVIRHRHLRHNMFYFGVEFTALSNEHRIQILEFLKTKASTRQIN